MLYRLASLLASEAANAAATKTIDVNINKPISRITVQLKATNNGSVPTAHPQKMLTKVELVDGSNVLASLSGIEGRALNFYERGFLPFALMDFRNDVQCSAIVELNFGRFLWDTLYAFDPKKFNNPQLRITHNLAAGGSSPDAATLTVYAHTFDEQAAAPVGFFTSKEQYSYTLTASAKEKIELATDMPYRFLMLQSLYSGKQPWENYNKIKLSEDNDSRVIINDESVSDLIKLFQGDARIVEQIMALDLDAAPAIYCTPTYDQNVVALGLSAADTALFTTQGSGGTFNATGTNAQHSQMQVSGLLPHGALCLPFGDPKNSADWYDVSKIGSLIAWITAGSGAVGTVEVVSQQVRKY